MGDGAGALERAAELLGGARLPVIGGLLTDIAGAQAALALAEKLGGVVDHAAGTALTRAARIRRETGVCAASFGEVRNRADVVVILGDAPLDQDPALLDTLFPPHDGLPRPGNAKRQLIALGGRKPSAPKGVPLTSIEIGKGGLPAAIAMLAAGVGQRRFALKDKSLQDKIESVADKLREAAFVVFVYSAAELEEPVLHTVLQIVRDLSNKTRAAMLALPAPGNGDGVNLCSTWTCGLPVRTSFARGVPVHDGWLYAADRLIASGEADALLWIDGLDGQPSALPGRVPTVVLSARSGSHRRGDIVIEVANAGTDHEAALYLPAITGIGMVRPSGQGSGKPTVAAVLTRLSEIIDARGGR